MTTSDEMRTETWWELERAKLGGGWSQTVGKWRTDEAAQVALARAQKQCGARLVKVTVTREAQP